MSIQLQQTEFYKEWLGFSNNRSLVECDFFEPKDEPVIELLGDFSNKRLIAFGEHASGSLLAFYSKNNKSSVEETAVAWLDSEGSPCIVISINLKEFLSILPYGMGFIYSIASIIENNMGDSTILEKVRQKITKSADELMAESKKRFSSINDLLVWLDAKKILVSDDPVKIIVEAHEKNSDLTLWITENIT